MKLNVATSNRGIISSLHANTLIFPDCDSLTGRSEVTPQELFLHSWALSRNRAGPLSFYSTKLTPDRSGLTTLFLILSDVIIISPNAFSSLVCFYVLWNQTGRLWTISPFR